MAKNKLVIGFVFDDSLDKSDGVQQYVLGLGKRYRSMGHEVHYIVGATTRTDLPNIHSMSRNMRVSFNGNKMSMPLPAKRKKIKALFARHAFDVLHVQMPHSPFMAARVINMAPKSTHVVGTFHILPHSQTVVLANKILKKLLYRSLKRIDTIVSVSSAAQAFLKENWHLDSAVVPNHVDVSRYLARKPIKGLEDSLNIVFLGRLVERKGCMQLLQAIKQIVRLNLTKASFKVVICGDGPLRKSLESFVSMNGLKHMVTFVGFLDELEKPQYLSASDIAVFPATGGESFGIVLLEAMAASRGVVLGGDNPGYRSVLGEHETQLFDPNNTHDFAQLIVKYLHDDKLRVNAHDWQVADVARYDVGAVANELLAIYAGSKPLAK